MRFARQCGFVIIAFLSIVSFVTAQDSCSADVDEAIALLNDVCLGIGRNQACYGNGDIVAIPISNATIDFVVPGDSATVDNIASLALSPFEADFAEWGVAVLVLQASLPDTLPGQNVTMLLLGDTSFSNDNGAYYFTSGIGSPTCNQVPNGVMIQTPAGVGEVNLTMNGINITLGSTAYLGMLEENILTFALLEGNSTLSVEESDIVLVGEQFTTIELDEDGNANGEFSEAEDIELLDLPQLPIVLLPESLEENDSPVLSGDVIIPLSGEWLTTIDFFNFEGECPDVFDEAMARQMAGFGAEDTFTQEFTIDSNEFDITNIFRTEEFGSEGVDFTYSNPEPNLHIMNVVIDDIGGGTYIWHIISEERIENQIIQHLVIPDFADCTITSSILHEWQG